MGNQLVNTMFVLMAKINLKQHKVDVNRLVKHFPDFFDHKHEIKGYYHTEEEKQTGSINLVAVYNREDGVRFDIYPDGRIKQFSAYNRKYVAPDDSWIINDFVEGTSYDSFGDTIGEYVWPYLNY